jgi:hypothetical protein
VCTKWWCIKTWKLKQCLNFSDNVTVSTALWCCYFNSVSVVNSNPRKLSPEFSLTLPSTLTLYIRFIKNTTFPSAKIFVSNKKGIVHYTGPYMSAARKQTSPSYYCCWLATTSTVIVCIRKAVPQCSHQICILCHCMKCDRYIKMFLKR